MVTVEELAPYREETATLHHQLHIQPELAMRNGRLRG